MILTITILPNEIKNLIQIINSFYYNNYNQREKLETGIVNNC